MKYSKLFGKTIKEAPKDATLISHKLLYQAGFLRESTAGRYYLLPLGLRVHDQIKKIIKEEMDKAGAQEMVTPVLHPIELWQETNRTSSVGFELMKIKDRNDMEFVLGGTAEEMLVDVVRKFQISYKDLPFHVYQFSTKFRDELRARGGLLRLREFVMKDGYSFHATEEDFKIEYEKMKQVYAKIFDRLGLKTIIVESDNGYIGGEYCHEFIVESEAGESRFLMTEDGSYAAHEDVAVFQRDEKNLTDKALPMEEVEAARGNTMEDGVALHSLPLWQQMKDLMMVDEKGNMILAVIRGDLDVNEVKLAHIVEAYSLRHATVEEIRNVGSEPGFISPIGLNKKVRVVGDLSLRTVKNMYTGANKKHRDLLNVNIDRDYKPDIEGDIALAKEGDVILVSRNEVKTHPGSDEILDKARMTRKRFVAKKGIEVGNIFQLGFHYSSKMSNASFTDDTGRKRPYYMGCYGIGLARTLATVVEVHSDSKGIVWSDSIAPYQVHLIDLKTQNSKVKTKSDLVKTTTQISKLSGEQVYEELQDAGIEVLFDDRDNLSAGAKFADCDLIGIPVRLVVSEKTGDKIEWKKRGEDETELLTIEEILKRIQNDK